MVPLSLYEEGLRNFRDDFKKLHREPKYEAQLEDYLEARNSADDAKRSCESLQQETQKSTVPSKSVTMWSSRRSGPRTF